jgi:plastocyanin
MHGSVSVAAGADSDTIHVRIVNASSTGFQPASVTVKPGGVVIWSNVSGLTHTVTSD